LLARDSVETSELDIGEIREKTNLNN
jgi:hypothetical protein